MKKVKVKLLGNSYDILIEKNNLEALRVELEKKKFNKNILAVIDKNFYTLYKKQIESFLTPPLGKFTYTQIDSKESNKSLSSLKRIYSSLVVSDYGRDSLILAIGGGVVGDIAGFAAATYSRGIQYVQVPTTLLAAVDSSVGGKTGVNFGDTKNAVGAFYQPELVFIDTSFLKSLPKQEVISGIGEITKYAFLTDREFFDYVFENFDNLVNLQDAVVKKVISESVTFKSEVVKSDEKEESGLRKILNLGHTFGHAIEIDSKHKINHGAAVIIGLSIALFLSNRIGMLKDEDFNSGMELIKKTTSHIKYTKYSKSNMLKIMKRDKKSKDGQYRFVLIKKIGKVAVDVQVDKDDLSYAIDEGLKLFSR